MVSNWETICQKAKTVLDQGDIYEAAKIFEISLKEAEKEFGTDHPNYTLSLIGLASIYFKLKKYNEAEKMYQLAWDKNALLGTTKNLYFIKVILNHLSKLYISLNQYGKIEQIYIKVLKLWEKFVGKNCPDYALYLNNLAMLYQRNKQYDKAELLYKQALSIIDANLGRNTSEYAKFLLNLADLYTKTKKYEEAEQLWIQVENISEKSNCKTNVVSVNISGNNNLPVSEHVIALNNLFRIYFSRKEYDKAISYNLKITNVLKHQLGEKNDFYIKALEALADVYIKIEKLSQAELILKKVVYLREQNLKKDHPDDEKLSIVNSLEIGSDILRKGHPAYAISLKKLARFYTYLGDYKKSLPLYSQIYCINNVVLTQKYPTFFLYINTDHTFNNIFGQQQKNPQWASDPFILHTISTFYELGSTYLHNKDSIGSNKFLSMALMASERVLGQNHSLYIESLRAMAQVYAHMNNNKKAETYLNKALSILDNNNQKQSPIYLQILNNLADLYMINKKFNCSKNLYKKFLEITNHNTEIINQSNWETLCSFGLTEIRSGNYIDGTKKIIKGLKLQYQVIIKMSEKRDEKLIKKYINERQLYLFTLFSTFFQHYTELQTHTSEIFDIVLKLKGINLEINAIRRDSLYAHKNPNINKKIEQLNRARLMMSNLMYERHFSYKETIENIFSSDDEGSENLNCQRQLNAKIDKISNKIEIFEKELLCQIPQIALQKNLENINYKIILDLIQEGMVLIEFVCYTPFDIKKLNYLTPRYVAFLLSPNIDQNIQVVDIGDALEVDKLIDNYRYNIFSLNKKNKNRNIGVIANKKKKKSDFIDNLIYEKLLKPIIEKIGNLKNLVISSDGNILLLPLEIIKQPNGRYIIEDFEISYIDTGRDLLRFQSWHEPQSHPLILADPDFDMKNINQVSNSSSKIKGKRLIHLDSIRERSAELQKEDILYFPILEATKEEGKSIKNIFGEHADLWLNDQVIKNQVKRIKGPQILHIATHGFFFSNLFKEENKLDLYPGDPRFHRFTGNDYNNPLLSSGLALSGINRFFQGKPTDEKAEDGMLTALDVSGMDLIGTELVVLSACETGLGRIQTWDGVYGLRRAFTLAGARTLILSLWEVPDKETKDFMIIFYTKILQGIHKAKAIRETKIELLNNQRKSGRSDSPYFWGAAFICVGDPGKLEKICEKKLKLWNYNNHDDVKQRKLHSDTIITDEVFQQQKNVEKTIAADVIKQKKLEYEEATSNDYKCPNCGGIGLLFSWKQIVMIYFILVILLKLPSYSLWLWLFSFPLGVWLLKLFYTKIKLIIVYRNYIINCSKCGNSFIPAL